MFKEQADAYGELIAAYYNGIDVTEIVERDDGLISTSSGPVVYFQDYEQWPSHYKKAIRLVKGSVLDVGSGAGRIALYLQKQGHEILAIDNSPKALEVCRLRGVQKTKICPITQLSKRLGIFNNIVMLGNNFGLFGSYKRAKWLLKRFYGMTPPEGRIIAESSDVYATDDPIHLAYHLKNRQRGRMSGQLRLRIRYQKFKTPWFDYLIVSKPEMKEILMGTGWIINQIFDSEGPNYIAEIIKEK